MLSKNYTSICCTSWPLLFALPFVPQASSLLLVLILILTFQRILGLDKWLDQLLMWVKFDHLCNGDSERGKYPTPQSPSSDTYLHQLLENWPLSSKCLSCRSWTLDGKNGERTTLIICNILAARFHAGAFAVLRCREAFLQNAKTCLLVWFVEGMTRLYSNCCNTVLYWEREREGRKEESREGPTGNIGWGMQGQINIRSIVLTLQWCKLQDTKRI